jgi:hypothetical protein
MSNGFGQSPKKQTVYSGPAIKTIEGTVYNGPAVAPRGGTVYNGDSGAGHAYSPARRPGGSLAASGHAHKTGSVFFLIAGLSMLNTFLAMSGTPMALALGLGITRMFDASLRQGGSIGPVLGLNAVVASVFVLIGIFARQGRAAAILLGFVLYAGDTVLLVMDGVDLHIPSLIVHVIFLIGIFRSYRMVNAKA